MAHVERLEQKIRELEKNNHRLQHSLELLKNNPPIHVDRIDYHFDQLKIERLEGTLNIGINPLDPEQVEEFSAHPGAIFPINPQIVQKLYERLYQFIDMELPGMIEDEKRDFGLQLDQSYTEFIQQDIIKQLKTRIETYLQTRKFSAKSPEEQEEEVYHAIKNDILQAVRAFLSQFPMKGDEKNDF